MNQFLVNLSVDTVLLQGTVNYAQTEMVSASS